MGTTAAGVNAFFVRKDVSAPFIKHTAQSGFHPSANRDARDKNGRLSFLPHHQRLNAIKALPVTAVDTGATHLIKDLYGL